MAETLASLLRTARQAFAAAGIETDALDARLLAMAATGLSLEEMVAEPDRVVSAGAVKVFQAAVARRLTREPVSRILGEREFYGRRFRVTPAVLDPRPDTETLIDLVLPIARAKTAPRLLDLGTGSGILAITLAAEIPDATGVATDLSAAALAVAEANAEALGVSSRLRFVQANWFDGAGGRFDLIVSNPPYIPAGEIAGLAADVRDHDPHLALAGGADGLDCYRSLAARALAHLVPGGLMAVEIGAGQAEAVTGIFVAEGLCPAGQGHDLGGHLRVLAFRPH